MMLHRFTCSGLLLLCAFCWTAAAQPVPVDTDASTLAYTGRHPLHRFTGVSRSVRGTVDVDVQAPARSRVEIVVPVTSFDSGNSNRDSNMLGVVEAEVYPEVRFTAEAVAVERWEQTGTGYRGVWHVRGPLTFHGRTQSVEIPVRVTVEGRAFTAEAAFQLSLDAFGVERPRLLLMAIDNQLDLEGFIRATLPAPAGS